VLQTFPHLHREAVEEALRFAAESLKHDSLVTAEIAS
jgi:uncharacterized protein (DUF433 family)